MLIPWERSNAPIALDLQLLTQDGQPVQGSEGAEIGIQARTEVGRPPGIEPGIPDRSAPHFPRGRDATARRPLHVALSVNGETRQAWQLSFTVINES